MSFLGLVFYALGCARISLESSITENHTPLVLPLHNFAVFQRIHELILLLRWLPLECWPIHRIWVRLLAYDDRSNRLGSFLYGRACSCWPRAIAIGSLGA